MHSLLRVGFAAGLAVLVSVACDKRVEPLCPGKNLLLISIDTLRPDHTSPYGHDLPTTTLQRLADEGVLFEEALSPVPLTQPAHTSLFTGNYPGHHGVRDNADFTLADDAVTLAEGLSASGYQTGAVLGAAVLVKRTGLAQGFESYDDDFDAAQIASKVPLVERNGAEVRDLALKWLDARDTKRPFALFVHFYDPHLPYAPPGKLAQKYTPYDGEIVHVDRCVGALVKKLEDQGLLENTVVVVLSDHGESLGEHGEAAHGLFLYDAAVRVPLIVRLPAAFGLRAKRVATPVSLIDVMPTVLDLLGIVAPATDGVSLVPLLRGGSIDARDLYGETLYPLLFRWSPSFSVRHAGHKYIHSPKSELYDLGVDRKELDNTLTKDPQRAHDLETTIAAQLKRWELGGATAHKNEDLGATRDIAALGYAGGGGVDLSTAADLPDMKERIDLYEDVMAGIGLMTEQKFPEAKERFERVLARDPKNPPAHLNLGEVLARTAEFDGAVSHFKTCLELVPSNRAAKASLALLYFSWKKLDDAQALYEELLKEAPHTPEVLYYLGQIQERRGERAKAFDYYAEAKRLLPTLPGIDARVEATRAKP
ncbi:MAG: sulfatase-like hydrolase/transferase [Planctomycetes bacterium]|nr:sulfatase-like hydrolase/transferase [Planctomycetota bacterium]